MLLVALIALVQLAVLVMILAVVTGPASPGTVEGSQPREQISRLEDLTVEAMFSEAAQAGRDVSDGQGRDTYR